MVSGADCGADCVSGSVLAAGYVSMRVNAKKARMNRHHAILHSNGLLLLGGDGDGGSPSPPIAG